MQSNKCNDDRTIEEMTASYRGQLVKDFMSAEEAAPSKKMDAWRNDLAAQSIEKKEKTTRWKAISAALVTLLLAALLSMTSEGVRKELSSCFIENQDGPTENFFDQNR